MGALKILIGLVMAGVTVWGFKVARADMPFMNQDLARILFWHLPAAFCTVIFLMAGAVQSVKALRQQGAVSVDSKAQAAMEVGTVFAIITMATGILFSKANWGSWWNWDPRQTSFLFVLLILFAYFAIRAAFTDPAKRAVNSAAYCLASMLPILFLIFVLPRLEQVKSLHPSETVPGGFLRGVYLYVVLANFVLYLAIGIWLYAMQVRASNLEHALENQDGKLDDGGERAPTGVVRPLSLSDEGG